jgi:hypothetical protein
MESAGKGVNQGAEAVREQVEQRRTRKQQANDLTLFRAMVTASDIIAPEGEHASWQFSAEIF